jgi:hypothetical protein
MASKLGFRWVLVESVSFIWAYTRQDERLGQIWTCEKKYMMGLQ